MKFATWTFTRSIAAVALLGCAGSVLAADPALTGTLKKIHDEGVIVIGYRESSIPFSYYDSTQKPIGYSMDFANLAVEQIKKKLNLPNLQVRRIPITSQNRISLLQNGTFDFECTTTTNNETRAQQIDFTNSIFQVSTRLLTKKTAASTTLPTSRAKPWWSVPARRRKRSCAT